MVKAELAPVWVTGASSGIGRAIVRHIASDSSRSGAIVIATARNRESLEEAFSDHKNVYCLPADVTDTESLALAAKDIQQAFGYVQHLYINAGTCEYVDGFPMDIAMLERLMAVNVTGAVKTLNAALPLLENSPKRARIIGVCSQAVFAPFPRAEFYGASKSAFAYLLNSLRLDLENKGIDVTAVYPGFVKTPLTDKNDFPMPFIQSPEKAASTIIQGVNKGKQTIIFPGRLRWLLGMSDYFPRVWQKLMTRNNSIWR